MLHLFVPIISTINDNETEHRANFTKINTLFVDVVVVVVVSIYLFTFLHIMYGYSLNMGFICFYLFYYRSFRLILFLYISYLASKYRYWFKTLFLFYLFCACTKLCEISFLSLNRRFEAFFIDFKRHLFYYFFYQFYHCLLIQLIF